MTDQAGLLEDWLTIWQSEAAALAADREVQETQQRMVDAWAAHARAALAWAVACDAAARPPGTAAPPGAPAAGAAPDERDRTIEQLLDRVAELERRLGPPAVP